jgi:hypothetical protein
LSLERGGSSRWQIKRDGSAQEYGMGYSVGTASLTDASIFISWHTTDNHQAGTLSLTLSDCKHGEGMMTWTKVGDIPADKLPKPQKATFSR